MTSLTQPLRIKKEFLPREIVNAAMDTVDELARQCAGQWEANLRKDGYRLTPGDYEGLVRHLKHEADITLSLSVKITEKKLEEEWLISPIPMSQKSLSDYSPEEERGARVDAVAEVVDTLLEKRRKAAAEQAGGE